MAFDQPIRYTFFIMSRLPLVLSLFILACLSIAGCEGFTEYFREPPTVVWIKSIDKVAGKWEGTVKQLLPEKRSAGSAVLTIENDGDYKLADKAGKLSDTGKLKLRGGRGVSETKERETLITLYGEKEQWLGVDVTLHTGERYYIEMKRTK